MLTALERTTDQMENPETTVHTDHELTPDEPENWNKNPSCIFIGQQPTTR